MGRKRIARLMRNADIHRVSRRRRFKTTTKDKKAQPAADLVNRVFSAAAPDELWVSDITFIPSDPSTRPVVTTLAARTSLGNPIFPPFRYSHATRINCL